MSALAPGARIGILGGGQLGRMLALAGASLGFDMGVYCPEEDSPGARVCAFNAIGDYTDAAALTAFARGCAALTFEFENVPVEAVQILEAAGLCVRPASAALLATQDRLAEKRFVTALGAEAAPFESVNDEGDARAALRRLGGEGILKTRRFGYDGHGQARVRSEDEAARAWRETLHGAPAIMEGVAPFVAEVSVIAARGADGALAFYDLCENTHEAGILRRTVAPSTLAARAEAPARAIAENVLHSLNYVGVMGIEFFVMGDGRLLVNEMAPRVHNSGHWTADACVTGQFEQHIRAVAGWPLGETRRWAAVEMRNLLGEEAGAVAELAQDPAAKVHLYGKREARAGRKMGHVTRLSPVGKPV